MVYSLAILLLSAIQLPWRVTESEQDFNKARFILNVQDYDAIAVLKVIEEGPKRLKPSREEWVFEVQIAEVIEQVAGDALGEEVQIIVSWPQSYPPPPPGFPKLQASPKDCLAFLTMAPGGAFILEKFVKFNSIANQGYQQGIVKFYREWAVVQKIGGLLARREAQREVLVTAAEAQFLRGEALINMMHYYPHLELDRNKPVPWDPAFSRLSAVQLERLLCLLSREEFFSEPGKIQLLFLARVQDVRVNQAFLRWKQLAMTGMIPIDDLVFLEYIRRLGCPEATEILGLFWWDSGKQNYLQRWSYQPDPRLFWSTEEHRLKQLRALEGFPD